MYYRRLLDLQVGEEVKVPFKAKYIYHWHDGEYICIHVMIDGGKEINVVVVERNLRIKCPWNPEKRFITRKLLMVKRIDYGKV